MAGTSSQYWSLLCLVVSCDFFFCGVCLSMLKMLFLKKNVIRNLNLSLACPCSSAMCFVNFPTLQNVSNNLQRSNGLIKCDSGLKMAFHTIHA